MPRGALRHQGSPRASRLARAIAQVHGWPTDAMVALEGKGSVNHVFIMSSDAGRLVVRFPIDPLRGDEFEVEEWCLSQAGAHGVPSPRVVARGTMQEVPYLVEEFVPGRPGDDGPAMQMWRWLARYASKVHTIDVADGPDGLFSRFGRDIHAAWRAHLAYNAGALGRTDPLLRLGVYAADKQAGLRAAIDRVASRDLALGLIHGDLAPRNLIIPGDAPPVLVDWGTASTGPVPHADILPLIRAHRATGQPTADTLARFAASLGEPLDQSRQTLHDLLLLEALDLARWAIDRRPDLLGGIVRSSRALVQNPPTF